MSVYYVSPTGNDANVGSQLSPFATLQRGAAIAGPGDTIIAQPGIYESSGEYLCLLPHAGNSGEPITFLGPGAILDGVSWKYPYGFGFAANGQGWVNILGFEIRNFLSSGISMNSGSNGLADGNHDIIIANTNIHNIGNVLQSTAYGVVGIGAAQGSRNIHILNNQINTIGRLNGKGSADHGLYIGGGDYVIAGNTFHDNNEGWDIQIAGHAGDLDAGYFIAGNAFGAHNNVGGTSNPGNIVAWANTGKTPSGSLLNNTFVPTIGSPLHFYPQTTVGSPTWVISGNTYVSSAISSPIDGTGVNVV